jgi:FADH2 O2-dependent halogenase
VAISHGVTVLQNTLIQDINIQPDGMEIITNKDNTYHTEYIVDAGGMKSLPANKFNWRHHDCLTRSRAIFTRMVDVSCFNNVGPS